MAGGAEGYQNQVLEDVSGKRSFAGREFSNGSYRCRENLRSTDPHGHQPIFVGFGASYDQAQILADLPNTKVWEFSHPEKMVEAREGTA